MKKLSLIFLSILTIITISSTKVYASNNMVDVFQGMCANSTDHLLGTHEVIQCDFDFGVTLGNKFIITPIKSDTFFGVEGYHDSQDYEYHIYQFDSQWQVVTSTPLIEDDFAHYGGVYLLETQPTTTYITLWIEHSSHEPMFSVYDTADYSLIISELHAWPNDYMFDLISDIDNQPVNPAVLQAQYDLGVASVDTTSYYNAGMIEAFAQVDDSGGWLATLISIFDTIFSIQILPSITVGLLVAFVLVPPLVMNVLKWIFG